MSNLTAYQSPDQIYADFVSKLKPNQASNLSLAILKAYGKRVDGKNEVERGDVSRYIKVCLVRALGEGLLQHPKYTESDFTKLISFGERSVKQEKNGLVDLISKLPYFRDLYGQLDVATKFGAPIKSLLEQEAKEYATDFPEYRRIKKYFETSRKFIDQMLDLAGRSTQSPIDYRTLDTLAQSINLAKGFRNNLLWTVANTFGQEINPFVISDIELKKLLTALEYVIPDLSAPSAVDDFVKIITNRLDVFIEEEDSTYVTELIWRHGKILIDFFRQFKASGFIGNIYTSPILTEVARIEDDIAIYPDNKTAKMSIWTNGIVLPSGEILPDHESIVQCLRALKGTNQLKPAERTRLQTVLSLVKPLKDLEKQQQDMLEFEKGPLYTAFLEKYGDPEIILAQQQTNKNEFLRAQFLQRILEAGSEPNSYIHWQYSNLSKVGIKEGNTLNSTADYFSLDITQRATVWEIIRATYKRVGSKLSPEVIISLTPKRILPPVLRSLLDQLPVRKISLDLTSSPEIPSLEYLKRRANEVLRVIQEDQFYGLVLKDPETNRYFEMALNRYYNARTGKTNTPVEFLNIQNYVETCIQEAIQSISNGINELSELIYDLRVISNLDSITGYTNFVTAAEKRVGPPDFYKLGRLFGSLPFYSADSLKTIARTLLTEIENSNLIQFSKVNAITENSFSWLLSVVLREGIEIDNPRMYVQTGRRINQLAKYLALSGEVLPEFLAKNTETLLRKKTEYEESVRIIAENPEIFKYINRKRKLKKEIEDRIAQLRDLDAVIKPEL